MKRRNKVILAALICVSYFVIWRLLISYAIAGVRSYGDDMSQDTSELIICLLGDRTTILPVINVYDTSKDGRYIDAAVSMALTCLGNRFDLNSEEYVSRMVEIILKKRTSNYSRVQLISALEEVTGKRFGYVMYGCGDDELTPEMRKRNEEALKRIREWRAERLRARNGIKTRGG
jgi:hypothetical protein